MKYFDGIDYGDRVWSIKYGWGIVINFNRISYIDDTLFLICAEKEIVDEDALENTFEFYQDGREDYTDLNQTVFWDEVKFDAPKRKLTFEQCESMVESKEFEYDGDNNEIAYNCQSKSWDFFSRSFCKSPMVKYYDTNNVIKLKNLLNENEVKI